MDAHPHGAASCLPQILGGQLPQGRFTVVELDQRPNGAQVQDELERMTVGGWAAGCRCSLGSVARLGVEGAASSRWGLGRAAGWRAAGSGGLVAGTHACCLLNSNF